jgi:hypothetical protein
MKLSMSDWINKAELKPTGEENQINLRLNFYDANLK